MISLSLVMFSNCVASPGFFFVLFQNSRIGIEKRDCPACAIIRNLCVLRRFARFLDCFLEVNSHTH